MKFVIIGALVLLNFIFAHAANTQYVDLARSRKYIGGKDEGDLRVQAVLYQPAAKRKKPVKAEPNEGF